MTIKIIEEGSVLRTLLADKRGRFETDFPFQKQYTMLFVRPFMIPVAIDIDTRMTDEEDVLYEVPLNMRMYFMYSGLDENLARKSIGVVMRTGTGEEAFSFRPYPAAIDNLKELYAASSERERAGDDPSGSAIFTLDSGRAKHQKTEPASVGVDEFDDNGSSSNTAKSSTDKPTMTPAKDKSAKIEERYAAIEASKKVEQDQQVASSERSTGSQLDRNDAEQTFIQAQKEIKRSTQVDEEKREQHLADARAAKSSQNAYIITTPYPKQSSKLGPTLIKHATDDGVFMSEEVVLIETAGIRSEFRKAVYHWWLFDLTYYSKDNEEITEEEYAQIKDELGI